MLKKNVKHLVFLAALLIFLFIPSISLAAINLLPDCATGAGRCNINDIVQTFVNFARLLLGFVGSAALLMFVYGGFKWLTSGGSPDKIKSGQAIVTNAVIGLIVTFGAFTIIQFIYQSFGVKQEFRFGQECSQGGGTSATRGIYVPGANPPCVTSCATLGTIRIGNSNETTGYSPLLPENGTNCIFGFSDVPSDKACCQAKTR